MPFSAKPTGLSMATIYNGSNPAIAYANRVLDTSPIAYWKLNEGSGSTITDSSGNSYDGSYTGVTWDGTTFLTDPVPFWDGSNDYGNVHSAGYESAFDMDEGTLLVWCKVNSSGVWSDSTFRRFFQMARDASNAVFAFKRDTADTITFQRTGNGTTRAVNATFSGTGWFSLMLSWSVANDELKAYINGNQQGTTQTSNVASVGSGLLTTQTLLGANTTTPLQVWHGYQSQAIAWDSPVDAAKLALMTV